MGDGYTEGSDNPVAAPSAATAQPAATPAHGPATNGLNTRDIQTLCLTGLAVLSLGSTLALSWTVILRDGGHNLAPIVVTIPVSVPVAMPAQMGGPAAPLGIVAASQPAIAAALPTSPVGGGERYGTGPVGSDHDIIFAGVRGDALQKVSNPDAVDAEGIVVAGQSDSFAHASLSLFDAAADVDPAFTPPARDNPEMRVAPGSSIPISALNRPDLNRSMTLTAVEFPFAGESGSSRADTRRSASSGTAASLSDAGAMAALETAVDPQRFGSSAPALAYTSPQGPAKDNGSAAPVDQAKANIWGRLTRDVAENATEIVSRNAPGEDRQPASDSFSRSAAATPPPGMESEDAFFSPRATSREETVFEAVKRSAAANGLTPTMAIQLLNLLSADYDFDQPVAQGDRLDVFFTGADARGAATGQSEFYFVRATFGGAYKAFYRYQNENGTVEYYGPEGRSTQQTMLRNPVPGGHFESGFGMRRHPILGYERMHKGVDWSAPKGTPIFATAGGKVERAGPNKGYGLQTVIRHDNGYTTSYAHQSVIADGITAGADVRQGQVIGFVGATGLATGAHIHYEVALDGEAIDPERLPVADGPMLKGDKLDVFLAERDRIDTLAYEADQSRVDLVAAGN